MNKLKLILVCFVIFSVSLAGFCQDGGSGDEKSSQLTPAEIKQAVREAIREANLEERKRQEELRIELKQSLDRAASDWIDSAAKEKSYQLNKLIEQNWENTIDNFAELAPRGHYEYYLRDYEYRLEAVDIVHTESLIVPYQANLVVTEILYVEREHPSNVSQRENFFYTAKTPLKVHLERQGDDFVFAGIEHKNTSIEQSWPEEIIDKLKVRLTR